jgi:toxin ParE1/3/4
MKWRTNYIQMKKFKLRINIFAQEDIEKTIEYYNDKREGLGNEFWDETKTKLESIEENPNKFQIVQEETRRANLKRFPYGIYYVVKDLIISVFGVIHFSRTPKTWQNRLENSDEEK